MLGALPHGDGYDVPTSLRVACTYDETATPQIHAQYEKRGDPSGSVVEILVSSQSYTLEDLVGYSEADAVQRIIEDYHVLQAERIRRRIGMCRTRFSSLPPEALKARRARIFTLRIAGDDVRDVLPCPACGCASQLFGQILSRRDEGALDEDEPWIRSIRCKVAATGLECEACGLELNGDEELDVGGVSDTYELSTVEEEEEEEPYMDE